MATIETGFSERAGERKAAERERAAIVRWLRDGWPEGNETERLTKKIAGTLATAIEGGSHLE